METAFVLRLTFSLASIMLVSSVDYPPLGEFEEILNPLLPTPESPAEIGTKFLLYTGNSKFTPTQIFYDVPGSISKSNYNREGKTKFLVHGYNSGGDSRWVQTMKNALIDSTDCKFCNVIVVDWENGATKAFYGQAASNTRVVGAEIGYLMMNIQSEFPAETDFLNFHVIGHSLGAHVGGYAGDYLNKNNADMLGRISGMDPAGPLFEDIRAKYRLDPSDAVFVDAMHTDGDPFTNAGFGTLVPMGHADFYPNGGTDQPGCPGNEVDDGPRWRISCSHSRAHELYIDSIINDRVPMIGHECKDYSTYKTGVCNDCSSSSCLTMGYYSDVLADNSREEVEYYLYTASSSPYGNI